MSLGPTERPRERRIAGAFVCAAVFALVVITAVFQRLHDVPFLSEDWTHLAEAREQRSIFAALDPRLEPLRPFQHTFFWLLAHCGIPWTEPLLPALARSLAFGMHLASCALVFALARELGLSKTSAAVAMALFVAFPNVKSLAWPAAIGSPGRVACELAALTSFVRWTRTSSRAAGMLALVFFVLALGFHESAMLVPVFFVLWIVLGGESSLRERLAVLTRKIREPALGLACAGTAAYVVYLALFRSQRHHDWKSFDALPANGVKAALALVPGSVRAFAIEGLRSHAGALGWIIGVAALLVVAVLFARALTRSPLARFLALSIAIELALPVLGTGFAQRYAYLALALLAIGLAAWIDDESRPRRTLVRARIVVATIAILGLVDTAIDASDVAAAGGCANDVITSVQIEHVAAPAELVIAVVDLPDMMGRESDVPVFNWGADIAFAENGVGARWLFWRTHDFHTTTNVERVDEQRLEDAIRSGNPRVLVYRPGSGLVDAREFGLGK